MNFINKQKLITIVTLMLPVPQLMIAQFVMPQMYAIPHPPVAVPIAMPMPFAVPVPVKEETTTTTTSTTQRSVAIALPIPMPMAVQIAVPAYSPPAYCQARPRPNNCPPCPPCLCTPTCTPSFFAYCSPCHLKCRCRNREDTPIPQPPVPPQPIPGPAYPFPVPIPSFIGSPPVVVVPFPPPSPPKLPKFRPRLPQISSSDSSDTDITSSSSSERRRRKHNKKRRGRKWKGHAGRRMQAKDIEVSDNDLVKPVFSYISKSGDVKFNKRISRDEAEQLLGRNRNNRRSQSVQVVAGGDSNDKSRVSVVSNDGYDLDSRRNRQIVLRKGMTEHILGEGRKELLFRPPEDKKIKNLSLTFQIEK